MFRPCVLFGLIMLLSGCISRDHGKFEPFSDNYQTYAQSIEYPEVDEENNYQPDPNSRPPSIRAGEMKKWKLSLDQVIEIALKNSEVVKNLGLVVASPEVSRTIYDPAIQETDPFTGPEAALSDFDTQFAASLLVNRDDRSFNNVFFGGGATSLTSQVGDFNMALSKTTAAGTRLRAENITTYNFNTSAFNLFPSTFETVMQLEARQSLWRGIEYMRTVGPTGGPGNYRGVVIRRMNSDIALADFEASVRDFLRDVQNAYWELVFAYRDLDAKLSGRENARQSWRIQKALVDGDTAPADSEALIRQQYYAAQTQVENALSGNSTGRGGVFAAERRLRRLLGLPTSDGRLILPSSKPAMVDVRFSWQESLAQALWQRVEIRRQKWRIKQRELELVGARHFDRMQIDFVGQYRWRGFGDELFGERNRMNGSAFDNLYDGNLQGWRLGVEVAGPVGNRIGRLAIRNAELRVRREHALLREQQRQVEHDLSASFTELDRAYSVVKSTYNRHVATLIHLQAELRRFKAGTQNLEFVVTAQQRAVDAESAYHRAVIDYNLALMNIHFARGSMLQLLNIRLAEGPWSEDAHRSAAKQARRFKPINYCMEAPCQVTRGPVEHHGEP